MAYYARAKGYAYGSLCNLHAIYFFSNLSRLKEGCAPIMFAASDNVFTPYTICFHLHAQQSGQQQRKSWQPVPWAVPDDDEYSQHTHTPCVTEGYCILMSLCVWVLILDNNMCTLAMHLKSCTCCECICLAYLCNDAFNQHMNLACVAIFATGYVALFLAKCPWR